MKKILCLIALLPFAASAAVVGPDTVNAPVANAAAAQAQGQDQLQGQAQGQLQGQGQSQGNFNSVGVGVDNDVRNANTNLVGVDVGVDNRVNSTSVSGADSTSVSGAISGSLAGARADQSQSIAEGAVTNSTATDQSQTQEATATNAGNTQSINYVEATDKTVRSKGTVEVRSVPTAIAPNVYPTASCAMSASVGASALGWGASAGGTKVNEECMMLEGARMFSQLGYLVQGLTLACSTKSSLAVYGTAQACLDAGTRYAVELPVTQPVVPAMPAKVETTVPFGAAQ